MKAMKDLTKTEEIILLTIWRLKDEAYGVRIRRLISELIGKDFTYGNLYSALNQLTKSVPSLRLSLADLNDQAIDGGIPGLELDLHFM